MATQKANYGTNLFLFSSFVTLKSWIIWLMSSLIKPGFCRLLTISRSLDSPLRSIARWIAPLNRRLVAYSISSSFLNSFHRLFDLVFLLSIAWSFIFFLQFAHRSFHDLLHRSFHCSIHRSSFRSPPLFTPHTAPRIVCSLASIAQSFPGLCIFHSHRSLCYSFHRFFQRSWTLITSRFAR